MTNINDMTDVTDAELTETSGGFLLPLVMYAALAYLVKSVIDEYCDNSEP